MKTVWFKGAGKDEQESIRELFALATKFRKKMVKVIEEKAKESSTSSLSKEGYDCPNWAFKQADNVGYNRALSEIISLLE